MPPSDLFGKSLTVFEFKLYGLVFCDFPEVPQFDLTEDNALCGYPHVKVSIRNLGQFSTSASIFQ